MADTAAPYCTATVVRGFDPLREEETALGSFEEVVAHLRATHGWFADIMADRRAEDETPAEVPVGGFGVRLHNRWDGKVEVGVGRDVWFLFRHVPKPSQRYSNRPLLDGSLAFWLDGWHYTELESDMLVSQAACLEALRRWLETGEFPSRGG